MERFIFGANHKQSIQLKLMYLRERMDVENRALDRRLSADEYIAHHIERNKMIGQEIKEICID
jgi:hypothetical protein